jgi:hypothetical protein
MTRNPAPDQSGPDDPVYQFRKNAIEVVQARLSFFHGHQLVDIRAYYEAEDGSFRPTKKGLAVGLDLLPELRAAVEALERAVAGRGLAA